MKTSGNFSLSLLMLLTFPFAAIIQAQLPTTCPNSNFGNGNFDNWIGCRGTFGSPCQTQGLDTTGAYPTHKIMRDDTAHDPRTCNHVLKVYPGETYSARLGHDGNSTVGGSQLKFTIQPNTEPYWFKYRYAVVLDNSSHPSSQQPSFTVEIRDGSGIIVDSVHGRHYYVASFLLGWQTCSLPGGNVVWLNWTSDSVELSSFTGQTITATFTSRDCQPGGHHGYAYICAYCSGPIERHWNGLADELWNNPANWTPAGVPSSTDIVIIPQNPPHTPTVNVSGMTCQTLHLWNNASVTIPSGITLTVSGDIIMDAP